MTELLENNSLYEWELTLEICESIENAWKNEELPQEEIEKILSTNN